MTLFATVGCGEGNQAPAAVNTKAEAPSADVPAQMTERISLQTASPRRAALGAAPQRFPRAAGGVVLAGDRARYAAMPFQATPLATAGFERQRTSAAALNKAANATAPATDPRPVNHEKQMSSNMRAVAAAARRVSDNSVEPGQAETNSE
jgi:hypothetical protein